MMHHMLLAGWTIGLVLSPIISIAYEMPTHESISRSAGVRSTVDEVLKERLGLSGGLGTNVRGQDLTVWLAQGGRNEDSFLRFLNHFHSPLADWSTAGLLGGVGQSSILWGQNVALSGWSWRDVRQAYFDALTRQPSADRDANLAKTFEGLGRQVHLVQDAASPAHTRNDPHALYNYESLVDDVRLRDQNTFSSWLAGSPDTAGGPDPGWRVLDGNPLAPVATARLIDADRYVGSNPATTTAALIGLAEYTNANFFSEDRIFAENEVDPLKRFPHPSRASVTEQDFDVQVGSATVKRRYFVKSAGGAGYRLATVGFLREYQQRFNLDWTRFRESPALDEGVYRDYAERLVPRAVAYSTALLDYFFRGRAGAFGDDLSVSLQNFSDDEAMDGTFALYYDDASEIRRPVPGATWVRALAPGEALEGLQVSAPTNPPAKDPGIYMLVFRGMLGSEADAVVGTQVMIESVILPRLIKRKDGTPIRGRMVQAIDVQSGEVLSSGFTDEEGRTRLSWRPGRTALFIPAVNLFPMYWAGGSTFSSGIEGARVVQTADRDAEGQVTILIPVISADWPERIEACTEQQVFSHAPDGFFQQSVLVGDGLLDLVSVLYDVNLITFIRGDNGQQTTLCGGLGSTFCVDPAAGFVAEDVNRVGQVVGELIRDMRSTHYRQITDTNLFPIGPPTCLNLYEEVEVVPVTVAER